MVSGDGLFSLPFRQQMAKRRPVERVRSGNIARFVSGCSVGHKTAELIVHGGFLGCTRMGICLVEWASSCEGVHHRARSVWAMASQNTWHSTGGGLLRNVMCIACVVLFRVSSIGVSLCFLRRMRLVNFREPSLALCIAGPPAAGELKNGRARASPWCWSCFL